MAAMKSTLKVKRRKTVLKVLYKYRKLMMKLKQVHHRQKKIKKNRKLLLLHVQPILLFHLSLECSGGPKHLLRN